MKLYKFTAGRKAALSTDKDGKNLPPGNWTFEREMEIKPDDKPRVGGDAKEILDAVAKDGYYAP